jgi:hypothetical protein
VITRLDNDSGRRTGLFQAAAELREQEDLPRHDREALERIATWFNENLETPTNLSISKRPHAKAQALSWFKDTALEHIRRMREMGQVLEEHGVRVAVISTSRPGYVTYEDEFQIAAQPFSDTPT